MFYLKNRKIKYIDELSFDDIKMFLISQKLVDCSNKKSFDKFEFDGNSKDDLKIVKSIFNDAEDKIVVRNGNQFFHLYTFGSFGLNKEQNIQWLGYLSNKYKASYYKNLIDYKNNRNH